MEQIVDDDPRTSSRRLAWVVGGAALFAAFGVNVMGIGHEGLANVRFVLFLVLTLVGLSASGYAILLTRDILRNPNDHYR